MKSKLIKLGKTVFEIRRDSSGREIHINTFHSGSGGMYFWVSKDNDRDDKRHVHKQLKEIGALAEELLKLKKEVEELLS